jgi:hypothetical protein
MRMMTRIKTTIPPPMYIAVTPFDSDSRILDEMLVVSDPLSLNVRSPATTRALTERRYLESS